jgi:phosphoglycerate kinase
MKTIDDLEFNGKTVLLRSDINSDIKDGKVLMNERIKESSITINELQKLGAKVIILAHQGRKGSEDFSQLRQHYELLKKFSNIEFVEDIIGDVASEAIKKMKPGQAIMLENIRSLDEEMKPGKNSLVKFFIGKVDIYVNDAFSVCHREQTSIVSFPKYFESCMGRILQREVEALQKVSLKNCLYILGGAKPKDNIKLLKKNKTIATGFFGQLCLISKGFKFGKYEEFLKEMLKEEFDIYKKLKRKTKDVILPIDYAVEINGKRKDLDLDEFPNDHVVYDIGQKTTQLFTEEIRRAETIYIKGPSGDCRKDLFCKGTVALLKAVSESNGFTLIGGGHLNDAIDKSKIPREKFGHISLSGGALLSYLSGEKLPGLEALK